MVDSTELTTQQKAQRGVARNNTYASRKRRNLFADMCMEEMAGILKFWKDIYQNPALSLTERLDAAERIVRRAVGEVAKPIEDSEAGTINNGPTLYQFQWLPPDPADRSKVIEPE